MLAWEILSWQRIVALQEHQTKMPRNVSKLTSQKFSLEVHAVKVVDGFIVVGLDLSLRSRKLCEFKCLYNPAKESPQPCAAKARERGESVI